MWATAGAIIMGIHALLWFGVLERRYWQHRGAIPMLGPAPRRWKSTAPRVAVLVPARNEGAAIEAAVRSLLAQSYPSLRIIVANDRSTDETRPILNRLLELPNARQRLVVIDVPGDPPDGWMGKCRALWHAAQQLRDDEELLLFADADVIHHRHTIARAVADMARHRVDLLAIFPRVDCGSFWESALMPVLVAIGIAALDPRKLNDPTSKEAAGIGAFTMMRRTMYDSWGGHEAIAGEVIDDMALAWMTKRQGGRMRLCQAGGGVHLRMYRGLGDIVRGFTKNAHTSFGGGMARAVVVASCFGFAHLGWLLGGALLVASTTGVTQWLTLLLTLATWLATSLVIARRAQGFARFDQRSMMMGYPLGVMLMMGIMLRSAWLGSVRGVVVWRGRTLRRPEQKVRML